jgi:integrase
MVHGRGDQFVEDVGDGAKHHALVGGTAVDAIKAVLRWKREQRLRLGPQFRDCGLVFCGPAGRPLNPSNIYQRDHLPRLVRLGLQRFRIHDPRHFHATYLITAGVDSRTAADRLGHADPGFLTRTYAHAVVAAQERAVSVANELLTKIVQS